MKEINTREEACAIVELFEKMLDKLDITVPSPEDDERGEDNTARLYGSVYWDLVNGTEASIIVMLENTSQKPEDSLAIRQRAYDISIALFQHSMQLLKDAFPKEKGGLKVNAGAYMDAGKEYASALKDRIGILILDKALGAAINYGSIGDEN